MSYVYHYYVYGMHISKEFQTRKDALDYAFNHMDYTTGSPDRIIDENGLIIYDDHALWSLYFQTSKEDK